LGIGIWLSIGKGWIMTMHLGDIRGKHNETRSIGNASCLWMAQYASIEKHLQCISIREREQRVQSAFCVIFDASLNQ
jgi:hypothetical protein